MVKEMMPDLAKAEHFICCESKPDGMLDYEELLSSGSPEEVFTDIDDNDVTILMYTAGTTGRPKGVPLTHNSFSDTHQCRFLFLYIFPNQSLHHRAYLHANHSYM